MFSWDFVAITSSQPPLTPLVDVYIPQIGKDHTHQGLTLPLYQWWSPCMGTADLEPTMNFLATRILFGTRHLGLATTKDSF